MNLNGPRKTRNENRYKFILSPKMFNVNVVELISMLKSALISMNDCDQNFRHHFVAINFSVKLIQCGKTGPINCNGIGRHVIWRSHE